MPNEIELLEKEAHEVYQVIDEENRELISEISNITRNNKTEQILNQIETPISMMDLKGIHKIRAIRQKIELQSIDGQSLQMMMPEVSDRAVFRVVFQILFQAQRVKEELVSFISDKEVETVLNDLNDVLITGLESVRLSEDQKSLLKALSEEMETLKTEFKKPLLEQSTDKIKNFEKMLDQKIQTIEHWVEPFTQLFL